MEDCRPSIARHRTVQSLVCCQILGCSAWLEFSLFKAGEYEWDEYEYGEYEYGEYEYGEYEYGGYEYGEYEYGEYEYGENEYGEYEYGEYEWDEYEYGEYEQKCKWSTKLLHQVSRNRLAQNQVTLQPVMSMVCRVS